MSTINQRIEIILKEKNMTRAALGDILNVAPQYISKLIKNGNPSDRLKEDICQKLDIRMEWLETGKGKMEKSISIGEQAYGRFGRIMEKGTPIQKSITTMLLSIVETLPDEQWEYIINEFNESLKRSKENEG